MVMSHVSYALDSLSLKLETIELLHSGLEIGSRLELHETVLTLEARLSHKFC